MYRIKSIVGSKDDELSPKPKAAIYPFKALSHIKPSLLEASRKAHPSTVGALSSFLLYGLNVCYCTYTIIRSTLVQAVQQQFHLSMLL